MAIHPLAGQPPTQEMITNIPILISKYFIETPNTENVEEQVAFGTSGHRGTSLKKSFTESHILAIVQAICDYRSQKGITGPLFLGKDTHALSEPAFMTAVEVLAANEVTTLVQSENGYTPTPVISHAILTYNKDREAGVADGIVITPSHNPPTDGGIKYNPPNGGPADTDITAWMEKRANELLKNNLKEVKRISFERAMKCGYIKNHDYLSVYIPDLQNVVDMHAIASSGLKLAADALGGSGLAYWGRIAEHYKFNISTYNCKCDPTFSFMTLDHDGKIRMDCSSRYAVAGLLRFKDQYDLAFGNDPDFDRHGIVTHDGLMNPNHYIAVAIQYLFTHRPLWNPQAQIGKTLVTSSMVDRVAHKIGRSICEVPVGFKWFVNGLLSGTFGFGGEESAGASFLRADGEVWTTDKDGIIMDLLAAELMAMTGKSPSEHYKQLTAELGTPIYTRTDTPATREQKAKIKALSPENVKADTLAGEKILDILTRAPGNDAPFGGLKVVTENGWFAARPSGTEDICKVYAESFKDEAHLQTILAEAQTIVESV